MAKLFIQQKRDNNTLTLQQLTIPMIITGRKYNYQLNYRWFSPSGSVLGSENQYYNRKELPIKRLLGGVSLFDIFQLFC